MVYLNLRKHKVYRGDDMDRQMVTASNSVQELELEILLHINERLFRNDGIAEEMYEKAKELILKV